MNEIDELIKEIAGKAEILSLQLSSLRAENEQLIDEILKIKEENEQLKQKVAELENNQLNLRLGLSLDNSEKERIKNNIDKLLNEIEKSLELLKT